MRYVDLSGIDAASLYVWALPLNESTALQRFECGNMVEIRIWNNVRFLPGTAIHALLN